MAQKGRVADDKIGGRPFRFFGVFRVGPIQNGIGPTDGVQGGEDGLLAVGKAVVAMPLDIANPQGGAGQFHGVGVDFQPQHLVGFDPGRQVVPALSGGVVDNLFFQVEEGAQGDIKEVAAAAGRIQHSNGKEAAAELLEGGLGRVHRALGLMAGHFPFDGGPFPAQGGHYHRLHYQHNVVGVGVMGAQLGTLAGVQYPLKEGAENRGLDVAPVLGGGVGQLADG